MREIHCKCQSVSNLVDEFDDPKRKALSPTEGQPDEKKNSKLQTTPPHTPKLNMSNSDVKVSAGVNGKPSL